MGYQPSAIGGCCLKKSHGAVPSVSARRLFGAFKRLTAFCILNQKKRKHCRESIVDFTPKVSLLAIESATDLIFFINPPYLSKAMLGWCFVSVREWLQNGLCKPANSEAVELF